MYLYQHRTACGKQNCLHLNLSQNLWAELKWAVYMHKPKGIKDLEMSCIKEYEVQDPSITVLQPLQPPTASQLQDLRFSPEHDPDLFSSTSKKNAGWWFCDTKICDTSDVTERK